MLQHENIHIDGYIYSIYVYFVTFKAKTIDDSVEDDWVVIGNVILTNNENKSLI